MLKRSLRDALIDSNQVQRNRHCSPACHTLLVPETLGNIARMIV